MIALATLFAPVTQQQARTTCVTQLVSYGIPANNWVPGGVFSTILTVVCWFFAGFSQIISSAINGMFLGTASGGWLTALAYYLYGVTRQQATYGTTSYTLTNTSGGVYAFAAGQFKAQAGSNGNVFSNVGSLTLASGTPASPSTATFTIQAIAPGSLGGAPAGAITTLVTSLTGVTGTNPAACLGLDAWTDAQTVAACYAALAARSQKGPPGAYLAAIYGYANVPGAANVVTGNPVNINRQQIYTDPDTGAITVYVASPSGAADPNDVAGVQIAIGQVAQPMGIIATAVSAVVVPFTAAIKVWSASSGTVVASSIALEAATAIDTMLAAYPIGGRTKPPGVQGYLFASAVVAAAGTADPTIYAVDLTPWTSLALAPGQVADLTSTITVGQVSP
jgi:hypothetical protein